MRSLTNCLLEAMPGNDFKGIVNTCNYKHLHLDGVAFRRVTFGGNEKQDVFDDSGVIGIQTRTHRVASSRRSMESDTLFSPMKSFLLDVSF